MDWENKVDNDLQKAIQFIMGTDRFNDLREGPVFRANARSYRVTYEVAKGSTILWIMVIQESSMSWVEAERGCSSKLAFINLENREGPTTYTDITPFFGDIHHPTREEIQLVCMVEPFICDCISQAGKDLLNHFGS